MITGKTRTGFDFEVNEKRMDDAEFLEKFVDMQKGEGLELFEIIAVVLGKEQKAALYEHCRSEDGIVSMEVLGDEMADIFTAMAEENETKN